MLTKISNDHSFLQSILNLLLPRTRMISVASAVKHNTIHRCPIKILETDIITFLPGAIAKSINYFKFDVLKQNNKNNFKITQSNLEKVLKSSNSLNSQSELIHEIFKAAKLKNTKNRKYSENWILHCMMLFKIRSPSGYTFLRDQNILPQQRVLFQL